MPEISVPLHAPELAEGVWVQGPPVSIGFARGAVVLVEFWESTCVNCLRTLPYVKEWHRRYAGRGLVVVGVHTPEFDLTKSPEVVAAAVAAEGIPYPVLLDPERATWRLFANHYWPARYLIDGRGYLRYEHFGEGAYGETESWIQRLLREAGDERPMPELFAPLRPEDRPGAVCHPATAELYLGWHRGRLISPEGYRPGEEVRHARPARLQAELQDTPLVPGAFAARGLFRHEAEFLEAREPGAELELLCEAAGIAVVLEPAAPEGGLEVEVDGAPVRVGERGAGLVEREGRTVAVWDRPASVELVAGPFARRRLTLRFLRPGLRAYTVAFTSCEVPAG